MQWNRNRSMLPGKLKKSLEHLISEKSNLWKQTKQKQTNKNAKIVEAYKQMCYFLSQFCFVNPCLIPRCPLLLYKNVPRPIPAVMHAHSKFRHRFDVDFFRWNIVVNLTSNQRWMMKFWRFFDDRRNILTFFDVEISSSIRRRIKVKIARWISILKY